MIGVSARRTAVGPRPGRGRRLWPSKALARPIRRIDHLHCYLYACAPHRLFGLPVQDREHMFRRILIVLEPHLHPGSVLRHGLALARTCLSDVVFFTRLTEPRPAASDLPDADLTPHRNALQSARLRTERLHAYAQQTAESLGVLSRSVIATAGGAERAILDAARSGRCDAIVVSCDGSNAWMRLVNGSVIPGLVSASPVPVIVCAPLPSTGGGTDPELNRILVVLEAGDMHQTARRQGLELAEKLAADLLFVHVTPSDIAPMVDVSGLVTGSGDVLAEAIQVQSRRLLASACTAAERAGLNARGMSLPAGATAKDIAQLSVRHACGLMVVSHRGSNAVMRLLTGSLVPGLITSAVTPVLICREAEAPPKRHASRRRQHRRRTNSVDAERSARSRDG